MENKVALLKLGSFVITDGGIYKKRNQIYFDSTDKALIKAFVDSAKDLNIKKISIVNGHEDLEANIYSKEISEMLVKLIGESKTIPIKEIEKLPKKEIQKILQILFTTDGGVSFSISKSKSDGKTRFHRKITFTSKNKKNLKSVQSLLEIFRIGSRIHGTDLVIKGRGNLMEFKNRIGFLKRAKVTNKSKKWKGVEKNKFLDVVIKSYRRTRGV